MTFKTMTFKTFAHTAFAAMLCAAFMSCDDDSDKESRLPVLGDLTFDKTTVYAGDTIQATLSMNDPGDYVKVTYSYSGTPNAVKAGTFDCGSSQDKASFKIPVDEMADTLFNKTDEESLTITVTVTPQRATAYVGKQLYLDPSSIGKKTHTFILKKKDN